MGILEPGYQENPVLVYPNPTGAPAILEQTLQQAETVSIRLINIQGQQIKDFVLNENPSTGNHQAVIHVPGSLPSGNYLLV